MVSTVRMTLARGGNKEDIVLTDETSVTLAGEIQIDIDKSSGLFDTIDTYSEAARQCRVMADFLDNERTGN